MAISNMQQPQQIQGGLGSLQDPRQGYFLGKLVKKATRAVKKVAKSKLGKAALIGGGLYLTGGMIGGGGLTGGMGNFRALGGALKGFGGNTLGKLKSGQGFMGGIGDMFRKGGESGADFSMARMLAGGLGATALAAPFLAGKDEPEEVGEVMDVANIRNRAQNYYSGLGDKGVGLNFMPDKQYVKQNFYAANGGRAGYAMGGDIEEEDEIAFARTGAGQRYIPQQTFLAMGGDAGNAQAEQMLKAEFVKYKNKGGDLSFEQFVQAVMQQQQQSQGMEQPTMMAADGGMAGMSVPGYGTPAGTNQFGYPSGGTRVNAAEGGIMDTEQAEMIDMGGQEKDYRDEGGFVAMGGEERADDVPARLSKNEFVITADAVRSAGGGDIDRGSEVMQNMMDNLEQGGQISQGSQGMGGEEEMISEEEMVEEPNGAQAMYDQQAMLQSRIA